MKLREKKSKKKQIKIDNERTVHISERNCINLFFSLVKKAKMDLVINIEQRPLQRFDRIR